MPVKMTTGLCSDSEQIVVEKRQRLWWKNRWLNYLLFDFRLRRSQECVHASLAVRVCNEIMKDQDNVTDTRMWCKLLAQLEPSPADQEAIKALRMLVATIIAVCDVLRAFFLCFCFKAVGMNALARELTCDT
jgi:hypothetical protein